MIELWNSLPDLAKALITLPVGVILFALLTAGGDLGGTG
jgi:hypothetical protein